MSHYAIGDVQGCFTDLQALLKKIDFDPNKDTLWFTGDLVNRGPQSLEVLRFVKSLGEKAITVLGNHDLHLLAVAASKQQQKKQDTLDEILNASDGKELCDWLRQQPLLHHDAILNYTLVHAGLAPQWNLAQALSYAHEVEIVLRSNNDKIFFEHMYGDQPDCWQNDLTGWDRLRTITNYLTRLRFCTINGKIDFLQKESAESCDKNYLPWFKVPQRATQNLNIIFGHWAALNGNTNTENIFALDTGCVWGSCLTAMRLEDRKKFSVFCDK